MEDQQMLEALLQPVYQLNLSSGREDLSAKFENTSAYITREDDCYTMSDTSQTWSTIFEGILAVIVGISGLVGNAATIAVLTRPAFKETFHKLLVCLSIFDSLFIGTGLPVYAVRAHKLHLQGSPVVHYMFIIFYPMASIALYASIYVTMAISIERYLGVCYPVQSRTRPRRHLLTYLVPVLIFAVGFNIPKAFETRVVEFQNSDNTTRIQGMDSEFSTDKNYTHYYKVWSNLIVTTVIPLLVLIFCNVGIFVTLRKSRKSMFGAPSQRRQTIQQRNENGLAIILVGIVLVFMVCHASRFFLAFYYVSISENTQRCLASESKQSQAPEWLYVVSAINHLMLMINSSVNFIIYCAVGSRFRHALACRLHNRGSSRYNMTTRPQGTQMMTFHGSCHAPPDLSPDIRGRRATLLVVSANGTQDKSPLSYRRESGIFIEEEEEEDQTYDERHQLMATGSQPQEDSNPAAGSANVGKSLPPFRFLLKRHTQEPVKELPVHSNAERSHWSHSVPLRDPRKRQETKSVKSYTDTSTLGSVDQWL